MAKKKKELSKYEQKVKEFNLEIIDLVEKYQHEFPYYEGVSALIIHAVSIALCCAPKEEYAHELIAASVQVGIDTHKKVHSKRKKKCSK